MPKVVEVDGQPGYYIFDCPGCKCSHFINTNPAYGGTWEFNKDMERPTVSPSLLINQGSVNPAQPQCHIFINNGMIQFLGDCTHELAGTTVPMPDFN